MSFCPCGLPEYEPLVALFKDNEGLHTCRKHFNKPYKNIRKPQPKFSGDSKYRQDLGMFQAKMGR